MCLVEFGTPALGPDRKPILNPDGTPRIAKAPRPAIACATPVSPGHGDLHGHPGREADARGRAGVPAHQPPARLPDLRPGRRMQAAGILGGVRPVRRAGSSRRRCTSPSASTSARASCWTTSAASSARAASASRATSWATMRWASSIAAATTPSPPIPGKAVRQQLHPQHRGPLPGRRADVEGFPVPDARLVPEGNQEPLHELRHGLQHRHRVARGQDLPLRAARERRRQRLLDVRLRPAELQVDRARGPADGSPRSEVRRPKSAGRMGCGA